MKVAAIIPAFNEEKTVGEVVKIISQSSIVDEIIVISDGSTDASAQKAREAGANVVHELPWRHGKGSAMSHGVTHTDAPILLFLDADLIGLTKKHIEDIVQPVLEGKRAMNVGLRERGFFWTKLAWYLPLIGGERAMQRQVFENIPGRYLSGFKAEGALNYYCRANHLPYGKVILRGIKIVRKMEKFGFWVGLWEYIKMGWQIIWAITEVRLARQVFTTKGAHEKHQH